MTNIFSSFLNLLQNQDSIAKVILIIVLLLYTLFALILANQIRSLSSIIDQIHFSPIFKFFGYVHVLAAIGLLLIIVLLL